MTIRTIKQELQSSSKPVAKSLHHNASFRVLLIGFKRGMAMAAHTAKWPSKLTVIEGAVTYKQEGQAFHLGQYDEHQIPVKIEHSVIADEDSLCLLTQSDEL